MASPSRYHWEVLAGWALERDWVRGAELGVRWGQTSSWLLQTCPDLTIIGVDLMRPQPGHDGPGEETYEHWPWEQYIEAVNGIKERFGDRFIMMEMDTGEAAAQIPDGSLDFVFIDADHSYAGVKRDIENWTPKVKAGGMVTGHDIDREPIRQAIKETLGAYETEAQRWNNIWWVQR